MPRDSLANTFKVSILLCLVCSLLVSAAAVGLRERKQANRERERNKNILSVAGIFDPAAHTDDDVSTLFEQRVEARIIDLESGEFLDEGDYSEPVDENYNQKAAVKDPSLSDPIPPERDVAGIKQREKYSWVYLVKGPQGDVDQIVLPIRGYGLWSTLWGFLSIDAPSLAQGSAQARIRGITFYEHGETPGLGGEVDNPTWKRLWENKRIFDENWNVEIEVIKGQVGEETPAAAYKVDGLSGATITSRGVSNMLAYWLGEDGFGTFLRMMGRQGLASGI